MCKWGEEENVWVIVTAEMSHTGKRRWKRVGIDRCIAPIVRALSIGGMEMTGSCCGHGKAPGEILLADGRTLVIQRAGHCATCDRPELCDWIKAGTAPCGQNAGYDGGAVASAFELAVDPSRSTPKRSGS